MAKADLNFDEMRGAIGRAVKQAIEAVGWSQKEAAAVIGREPAQIARWISGAERPQFDAILAVPELRKPFVVALAKLAECDVRTTIEVRSA